MEQISPLVGGIIAVLLCTSFVKVFTTLSILRAGVGLEGLGFGAVIAAVSLALSFLIMQPQLAPLGGLNAVFSGTLKVESGTAEKHFQPFLQKQSDPALTQRLKALANGVHGVAKAETTKNAESNPQDEFPVLVVSFLLTELKEAFLLGVLFILPFLVIDILVANVMVALGVVQMPITVVALPIKLLLFFAVDGWTLVSEKLIGAYL